MSQQSLAGDTPLVSVYWVSGYRGNAVVENAIHFRERTNWGRLELVVVDWSFEESNDRTREIISRSGVFDRVIHQDERSCIFRNNNLARSECGGEILVRFEDDVRLRNDVDKDWLSEIVMKMQSGVLDDFSLWSPSCMAPPTMASVSRLGGSRALPLYDSYPTEFPTVAESMRRGGGAFTEKYRRSGRRIIGLSIVETSLSLPSRNLSVLRDFGGYSWDSIEELAKQGISMERMSDEDYVSYDRYRELGGWEKMEWTVLHKPQARRRVQLRLNVGRRIQPLVVGLRRATSPVLRASKNIVKVVFGALRRTRG